MRCNRKSGLVEVNSFFIIFDYGTCGILKFTLKGEACELLLKTANV